MFLNEIVRIKQRELEASKRKAPLASLTPKIRKANHSFMKAIISKKPSIIAEIKSASPSEGKIRHFFSPVAVAEEYGRADIQAISVLTEKKYFGGDITLIQKVKNASKKPVLRKDFIIDEYQVYESRFYGADAILLIAEILSLKKINRFLDIAERLGMDAIVEAHEPEALIRALKSKAKIMGVNNRNLDTLETDKRTVSRLAEKIPKGRILVAESGIESPIDIALLPKNVRAVLIGTSIMRSDSIRTKLKELTSKSVKVKICGNSGIRDAGAALKSGADLLGFIINVSDAPDNLSIREAGRITSKINAKGKIVAVTRTKNLGEIRGICSKLSPDVVQLHGEISIPGLKNLRKEFPNIILMKSISVTGKGAIKKALGYEPYCDIILLDSKHGGSGKTHDWSVSREIVKKCKCPVFLAGGLNPDNVAKAIKMVKPFGVDVNSGVRLKPRIKDHGKIKKFIASAK
ncbi:indole-3-glycerol phosphate synthase TrpC [Candidatus Woesearchaeota archaeon]|nr:indole-3-glycerol phosphate synthase TrpC [Candidatus Woesearchaeota archaeon]